MAYGKKKHPVVTLPKLDWIIYSDLHKSLITFDFWLWRPVTVNSTDKVYSFVRSTIFDIRYRKVKKKKKKKSKELSISQAPKCLF